MGSIYGNRAKDLAKQPYIIMVSRDETTTGKPVFVARTLEIDNCFGQGNSPEEAKIDLHNALIDFIEGLLEDGLMTPTPVQLVKTQNTTSSTTIYHYKQIQEKYATVQDTYLLTTRA